MAADLPPVSSDPPRLTPRPKTMHKGQAGRVAILAGSSGMTGAAVLCGLGALRGGAGLVTVVTPAKALPFVATAEPCFMTKPHPDDADGRIVAAVTNPLAFCSDFQALAVGPGLGSGDTVKQAVLSDLRDFRGPVVLDADGLNNLADVSIDAWRGVAGPIIVTPHPGEMARLRRGLGLSEHVGERDEDRLRCAHEVAQRAENLVVVLKGHRTVVCSRDQAYVNATGNPGMATGGMGDVLTGLTAALLAQGLAPFDAACLAVHAHGAAADLLSREIGPFGYLAREVADALPRVLGR